MIRAIHALGVSFLLTTAAAGGCATTSGGSFRSHDVHASTRIAGEGGHVLVSGPAWLMHVDVEGRDDLALYAVARKDGTDADCASAQSVERKRLRAGAPNLVNMNVTAEEAICIAPAGNTRSASVMWHARRIDDQPAAGRGQTLAFDGPGR
jgi:hypothetical protein